MARRILRDHYRTETRGINPEIERYEISQALSEVNLEEEERRAAIIRAQLGARIEPDKKTIDAKAKWEGLFK